MKSKLIGTILMLAATASPTFAADPNQPKPDSYYKIPPHFHPFPEENKNLQSIDYFGPVGMGIFLLQPAFKMQVKNIEPGSPAEATGKLKKDQLIDSINGRVLKDMDPRLILGDIIAKAEATDGVVKLVVRDNADAPPQEVVVKIPVLGAYGKTWPLNDAKSDKIVRNLADQVAKSGGPGQMGLGSLFLLSTGDKKDLEVVRGWMQKIAADNKDKQVSPAHTWNIGYNGLALCEYYLRTGDTSILHTIKLWTEALKRTQFNGGWGHNGVGSCSYSQSGHLNAAGVHAFTFILLAKQCGVEVDEEMLQSALTYFYKFAGHGNVAYGDSLPETSFVDNGKTGGLAFSMGAAAALTPEGEKSVYARARDVSAGKSFYSTSWLLHGHTGGGIGEIWRGAAMGLMQQKQPQRYRAFMDGRAWFYDLSRRFDGSFVILGGGNTYQSAGDWGVAMGLSYTMPRKQLRMAGAAPTKFCKSYQLPARPWGNKADEAFFSLESMSIRGAKPLNPDKVRSLAVDGSMPINEALKNPNVSEELILQYAHHPELGLREYAANQIRGKKRTDLCLELLKSKDPRGRYTGILCISDLNDEIAGLLLGMVDNPEESWWVTRAAMEKLEGVRSELLKPHKDRLVYWLKHPDWWMSSAALFAVNGLIRDKEYAQEMMPIIGEMVTKKVRPGPIWQLEKMLRDASPEVKAMARDVLSKAYGEFPKVVMTPGGLKVDTAEPVQVGAFAWMMVKMPAGYDELYKIGKKRYPNQALAHQQFFLDANPDQFGPELREGFKQLIREQIIPEFVGYANHIASNRKLLMEEISSAVPFQHNLYYPRPRVDDLVDYRRRLDEKDYEWQDFGPAISTMKWDYLTFDPAEKCETGAPFRYRKVTPPAGMENWFAKDFQANPANGWKTGLQPIGQHKGQLTTFKRGCHMNYCKCETPMQSLWEKEVLLARGTFNFPKFKEGYRYRLVFGGMSHIGEGDGFEVYVNGKEMMKRERGPISREGGSTYAYNIDKAWWPDFENGNTSIAAKGFLHIEPNNTRNIFMIWLQEMKCPPFSEKDILDSVKVTPMTSTQWQALQDPNNMELDPEQGKFRWDGNFAPNEKVAGTWTQLGEVATPEAFVPTAAAHPHPLLPTKLTFAANGRTNDPLLYYTGDTLMHLNINWALGMSIRKIDGVDYLFIESGGFDAKRGPAWKPSVIVFKRG